MKPLKTQHPFWLYLVFISLISLANLSQASGNQGHGHDHHQEPHSFDVEVTLHLDGKNYQWHWESHEGRVSITAEIAKKVGISTAIAGPGKINRQLTAYGRLITPPSQLVQVRARFPGVITALNVNTGESVRQGDLLAVIESNESLQTYPVRAPLDGIVQTRASNVGEITTDLPLLTLINTERLWAELKIFPDQRSQVVAGQKIQVQHGNYTYESEISHITPSVDGSPFTLARAALNNQHQQMAPGDFVNAEILVETRDAPLVVHNRALQDFRDWRVVFIKVGNTYEIRPLELGISDGEVTQVLQGLNVGDEYVVDNSYLIKADIEKSGAAHDH